MGFAGDLGLRAAAGGDALGEALGHDRGDRAAADAPREPVADEVVEVAPDGHRRDASDSAAGSSRTLPDSASISRRSDRRSALSNCGMRSG